MFPNLHEQRRYNHTIHVNIITLIIGFIPNYIKYAIVYYEI